MEDVIIQDNVSSYNATFHSKKSEAQFIEYMLKRLEVNEAFARKTKDARIAYLKDVYALIIAETGTEEKKPKRKIKDEGEGAE